MRGHELNGNWLTLLAPRPRAAIRLVCFPYAGAGVSAFASWHFRLPDNVEQWVVQLPGRETRLREPLVTDLAAISDVVASSIELLERPVALFGHSMGALTAFETAKRLCARGVPPSALFLSGKGAPEWPGPSQDFERLSDDDFIAAMDRRYGGVPTLLKEDAEFRQIYLPALRADIAAVSRHRHTDGPPLECALHVLGGMSDDTAPRESLEAWSRQTVGEFKVHLFPGGHFYLQSVRSALLEFLTAELARTVNCEAART